MYEIKERPHKRAAQLTLTELIKYEAPDLINGHIIVISGPEPEVATRLYRKVGLTTKYTFVENDPFVFHSICAEILKYQLNAQSVLGNIFSVTIPDNVVGLDIDLLGSFSYERSLALLDIISRIKQDKFWLRFTTCHRTVTKQKRDKRIRHIRDGVSKLGFKIISDKMPNYKEINGPPMLCWQVICQRKTEEEMKQRTLGETSTAEQNMIRDLIATMRDDESVVKYSNKDIAKTFKISLRSVHAVKANMTMDEKQIGPGRR